MAHEFLSTEWLNAAQEIRESLGDVGPAPVELVMNLNVTEVPFAPAGLKANLDTRVGPLALEEGQQGVCAARARGRAQSDEPPR